MSEPVVTLCDLCASGRTVEQCATILQEEKKGLTLCSECTPKVIEYLLTQAELSGAPQNSQG